MDNLIFNKFDLKYVQIIANLDKELNRIRNEAAARGAFHSGALVKQVYEAVVGSSKEIFDVLLETYKEVQNETGENIIVKKESEVREDVRQLFGREYERVRAKVNNSIPKGLQSPAEFSSLFTELQNFSNKKIDILIDTEKRKLNKIKN